MAPAAASGGSTLPSGFSVFTTFPDLLFIFEFVSDSWPGKGLGDAEPCALSGAQHSSRTGSASSAGPGSIGAAGTGRGLSQGSPLPPPVVCPLLDQRNEGNSLQDYGGKTGFPTGVGCWQRVRRGRLLVRWSQSCARGPPDAPGAAEAHAALCAVG
nr:uncharacterized protein LOC105470742 [Macaca nemestrina]